MKNVLDIENATGTVAVPVTHELTEETVQKRLYELTEERVKELFAERDKRREKKKETTRKIILFTAYFVRGLYFLMSLGFAAILGRLSNDWRMIDTESEFISFAISTLFVGIFLFVAFILLVFLNTSKYEKNEKKSE